MVQILVFISTDVILGVIEYASNQNTQQTKVKGLLQIQAKAWTAQPRLQIKTVSKKRNLSHTLLLSNE